MFNRLNQLCVGMVNIAIEKATLKEGNQHILHNLSKLFASKIIKISDISNNCSLYLSVFNLI